MPDVFASLSHECADSGFHSPMFPHSYSANYNRRTTTPYGMITLTCYFGSYASAEHLLQQELYAPVMSYYCARTTPRGSGTFPDHGQRCLKSWSNSPGQREHSCPRSRRSTKKLSPKIVQDISIHPLPGIPFP
jgi:hypothetical protein